MNTPEMERLIRIESKLSAFIERQDAITNALLDKINAIELDLNQALWEDNHPLHTSGDSNGRQARTNGIFIQH